jgi:hypothetical protein
VQALSSTRHAPTKDRVCVGCLNNQIMKTKIIVSVLIVAAILILRSGLRDWDLMRCDFGKPGHPVILISMNTTHEVLSHTDFGVLQIALVQASKGEKRGVPMWFIQLPFGKWKPIG